MTNSPTKLAHYSGVFRGVLGAGEAICFGLDSIEIPYIKEAGGIFAFYATGVLGFYYLVLFQIDETNYFKDGEVGAVVPNHILEEKGFEKELEPSADDNSPNPGVADDKQRAGETTQQSIEVTKS